MCTFLKGFENQIINSMKINGWDGNEDTNKIQWTFSGALFYSIIVITTIGECNIILKLSYFSDAFQSTDNIFGMRSGITGLE